MITLLTLLGILFCPVLTLGLVLVHFGHSVLGIIAILVFIFGGNSKNN